MNNKIEHKPVFLKAEPFAIETKKPTLPLTSYESGLLPDVCFSDKDGNLYPAYTSLTHLELVASPVGLIHKTLIIGKMAFPVVNNPECFTKVGKKVYLNLAKLLNLSALNQSQVLTLVLASKNKQETTNLVYLSRYSLFKDPRKIENHGHLSLILDTLTMDFPYQRQGNKSNLMVCLDGKKLCFLLNPLA
ncbi:MAG: hypothetical protein LKM30_01250 [Bacilli bacterium]|jgi:hypothetical protein|nr:hypothetical protein [Bacilli bacterium]